MSKKTKVKILHDIPQEKAKKDDIGYIDGYVRGGNNRTYACVVISNFISLVPLGFLEVENE